MEKGRERRFITRLGTRGKINILAHLQPSLGYNHEF
jgi:hypothetical protein